MAAGAELGIVNFGMRALLSLRLEKNWPTWFRELRPIYGPFEAGLGRFVDLRKNDFIGREKAAPRRRRRAASSAASPSWSTRPTPTCSATSRSGTSGKVVGWVTSGGYAHYVDRSLAQGYVPKELRGRRRRASRSRSSASAARRRSSMSRCSIRKGRGCGGEASADVKAF